MKKLLIIVLIASSFVFYYFLTSEIEGQNVLVSRVIDGDTIVVNDLRARLKGVNAQEKGLIFSKEAENFLISRLENKSVRIERLGEDRYGRILVYIFDEGNVNLDLVKEGYAHAYFYEADKYSIKLDKAEDEARLNGRGLWRQSSNYGCLKILEFDYVSEGGEKLVLENHCSGFDVIIKDEATHIFEERIEKGFWEKDFEKIWNDDGDKLFIWDSEGLVLYYEY